MICSKGQRVKFLTKVLVQDVMILWMAHGVTTIMKMMEIAAVDCDVRSDGVES